MVPRVVAVPADTAIAPLAQATASSPLVVLQASKLFPGVASLAVTARFVFSTYH